LRFGGRDATFCLKGGYALERSPNLRLFGLEQDVRERVARTSNDGGNNPMSQRRRSILPTVIAALAVVGLVAFLLGGDGGRTTEAWQNIHPPVVPTQITPDGVPGNAGLPLPASR
jgi:hypothetical protein